MQRGTQPGNAENDEKLLLVGYAKIVIRKVKIYAQNCVKENHQVRQLQHQR